MVARSVDATRRREASIKPEGLTLRGAGMLPETGKPLEEHHLIAAVQYAAYIVVRYGEATVPTFERLERELSELRRRRSPVERARLALDAYSIDAGLKAIC